MDQLRFGAPENPDTARVVHGVVDGISFYGNCLGLPNIGGETVFDKVYQGNPLVNALSIGSLKHEDLKLAKAENPGDLVVLFGARTGADGIGGVSVLASETFDATGPSRRPAVQVGDPFAEKVLIECCLELFAAGVVAGIQDLGGAGLSCATSELASNGGRGMKVQLKNVLLRDESLTPEEILMSESQERMMAIVPKKHLKSFKKIVDRHEVEYSVLGKVIKKDRLYINWGKEEIVNVPPRTVAHDGPVYERPVKKPTTQKPLNEDTGESRKLARVNGNSSDLASQFIQIISSPNQADKSWVTGQYDRYVGGNTALAYPDGAGMIRVSETTGLGVAISTDANGRYCQLNPYEGAKLALAEAYRNVATSGAVPIAVTNCLNFGSPENSGVMWQFKQATTGLADGCLELGIPVTGGNVSFYNQTGDVAIYPTPVVGVLGVIDDVARRVPSGWQDDGNNLYLLGVTKDELDGSVWADVVHSHLGGRPPRVDLAYEKKLAELLHGASLQGLIASAMDLSEGGLAQTLTESVLRFNMGARVWLTEICERDGVDRTAALFSESTGRVLVSVGREDDVKFVGLCEARGIPVLRIGVTDDTDQLAIQDLASWKLNDLRAPWENTLPELFG
jgi:phosphoribosylformylglycinamidine synthase